MRASSGSRARPALPELEDIGILASTDPVALDRACVDLVYAADTARSAALRQRIESRHRAHALITPPRWASAR